jgi:hypothetical protein
MLKRFRDLLWPILERRRADEDAQLAEEDAKDIRHIEEANFASAPDLALKAATEIYRAEDERVRSSEAKAFNLLLVTAALISLLTYLESAIWEGKIGTAPKWLSLSILIVAVLYLVRAALWAFGAISVRSYHTVGPNDLASIWSDGKPVEKMIRETLIGARKNQHGANLKVSEVKMATAFLLRSVFAFGVLLLMQAGWEISTILIPQVRALICR